MKKLEIKKTKPAFIISTFKTDIIKVGLVFSISSFFIKKSTLANEYMSFRYSNSALVNISIVLFLNTMYLKQKDNWEVLALVIDKQTRLYIQPTVHWSNL